MRGRDAFLAVDLGASSGRMHLGRVGDSGLEFEEVHRFPNGPVQTLGKLHWDILAIYREIHEGLRRAATLADVRSVGIDSWGVDYGLLDAVGELIGNPYHYRDRRTDGVYDAVIAQVGAAELYARNGIAQLPFNTVFQLIADNNRVAATTLLLIPDLIAYWLTGRRVAELTNASTTGLIDCTDTSRPAWDSDLMAKLGINPGLFPELISPGEPIGDLLAEVASDSGLPDGASVIAVGSHDTASAVAGVPAGRRPFAYLSSGTWSLLGVELDTPLRNEQARLAGFTNECGVDATIRFLRNIMGLWLLQECQRSWGVSDPTELLDAAGALPPRHWLIDVNDPSLLAPGAMPERLAGACIRRGGEAPRTPAETTRCIIDSLAVAYLRALDDVRRLSGRDVEVIHLVGGGSRNQLLCQLTADACGLPVVAGPAEAATVGNLLLQARAAGAAPSGLADLRSLIRHGIRTYEPTGPQWPWQEAASRLGSPGANDLTRRT